MNKIIPEPMLSIFSSPEVRVLHEPSESKASRGSAGSRGEVPAALCQFALKGNLLVDEHSHHICSQETCGPEGHREAPNCNESTDKLCLSQRSLWGTKGNHRCPCHYSASESQSVTLNFFSFHEILVLGIFNLGLFVPRWNIGIGSSNPIVTVWF